MTVAWVETLQISNIIVGKIDLTKSGSLPKATKDKLRDLYNSLDSNSFFYLSPLFLSSALHQILFLLPKDFLPKFTFLIPVDKFMLRSETSDPCP